MAAPTAQQRRTRATLSIQSTPDSEPVALVAFDVDLSFTLVSNGDGKTARLDVDPDAPALRAEVVRALREAADRISEGAPRSTAEHDVEPARDLWGM